MNIEITAFTESKKFYYTVTYPIPLYKSHTYFKNLSTSVACW